MKNIGSSIKYPQPIRKQPRAISNPTLTRSPGSYQETKWVSLRPSSEAGNEEPKLFAALVSGSDDNPCSDLGR